MPRVLLGNVLTPYTLSRDFQEEC